MVDSLKFDTMTISEKLAMMERLWDELCINSDSIPSPEWHKDVLDAREKMVAEGKDKFHSLEAAKKRIQDRIL
ncbi:MAG: addiction module protein [Desulfobacterales bacterium]